MNAVAITKNDLIHYIKCSYKMPEVIKEIVKNHIIKEKAITLGIEISDDDLQKTADFVRSVNNFETAKDTWIWLKNHSLSIEDFEEIISNTLISSQLAKHLFEDKVERYFFEHMSKDTLAAIYEIIFQDEDLAMECFYSVQEQETSFFELAYRNIQETNLKRRCGFRGELNRQQLKPEISTAVFSSEPPCLIKPIKTNLGFHLVFVDDIVKPTLSENIKASIISTLFENWLEDEFENQYFPQLVI